eukprot:jgi/Botrbrau1/1048/Bobra.0076s0015.1
MKQSFGAGFPSLIPSIPERLPRLGNSFPTRLVPGHTRFGKTALKSRLDHDEPRSVVCPATRSFARPPPTTARAEYMSRRPRTTSTLGRMYEKSEGLLSFPPTMMLRPLRRVWTFRSPVSFRYPLTNGTRSA